MNLVVAFPAWFGSGMALAALAVALWLFSLRRGDVSIVDAFWSPMFLLSVGVYSALIEDRGPRTVLLLTLVAIWAVRLSAYIAWRNHGQPEDYRYREIRANHQPGFRYKSLYMVFGLQAGLAWLISLPLVAAVSGQATIGLLDALGALLWIIGFSFEAVGDLQLARFKSDPGNRGKVLDTGLWRYSRHPNYFGNFLMWWGFYCFALSAGAAWTVISPLLMSFLLLKVSGVALLEKDIGERRPAYADYTRRTNAFLPGPPKPGRGAQPRA